MAIIDKTLFRRVEFELYNYQKHLRELGEVRQDILYGSVKKPEGPMPEGHISDSTGVKGRDMAGLWDGEQGRWLEVIHDSVRLLPRELKMLVKYKYFDGMHGDTIAMKLHISQSLFYEWRETVIIRIVLLAAQRGLAKPIRDKNVVA